MRDARLRITLWTAAAGFAAVHTFIHRHGLANLDAVSYLDIARDYGDGRWSAALNTYWSPLYSWILAAALRLVDPSRTAEYPLLHAVNFAMFLVDLAALELLIRELQQRAESHGGRETALSARGWRLAVTAIFLWIAIQMVVVWLEDPDLLVLGAVILAAAALLRLERLARRTLDGDCCARTWALLGVAMGIGYLAKTAMLPLSSAFIGAAAAAAPRRRTRWRGVAISVGALALVAGPFIIALSLKEHRLTYGSSGALNYVWFVNHSADWPRGWPAHWPHPDRNPRLGEPRHPARLLLPHPATYEFAGPIDGTYPMWRDPAYWHAGVEPSINVRDQLRRLRISAADLYAILLLNPYNREFVNPQLAMAAIVIFMLAAGGLRRMHPAWLVIAPAAAGLAMYSLVYVEPRYIGGFVLLIWVGILVGLPASLRFAGSDNREKRIDPVSVAVAFTCGAAVVAATMVEAWPAVQRLRGNTISAMTPAEIASAFDGAGVRRGDRIAVVGNAQVASRWAHLLRTRIVAEVPEAEASTFWTADADTQNGVLRVVQPFARIVVAEWPAGTADAPPGWTAVARTGYLLRILGR